MQATGWKTRVECALRAAFLQGKRPGHSRQAPGWQESENSETDLWVTASFRRDARSQGDSGFRRDYGVSVAGKGSGARAAERAPLYVGKSGVLCPGEHRALFSLLALRTRTPHFSDGSEGQRRVGSPSCSPVFCFKRMACTCVRTTKGFSETRQSRTGKIRHPSPRVLR